MLILFEKSVLFCKTNTLIASVLTPEKATQSENLDGENRGRCRKYKPLNHSESLTHTGLSTDQVIFTNVKLGDLFSRKEFVKAETIRRDNSCYSREAAKAQYSDLSSCLVVFVLLGLGRLSRAWNQTGIKWADRPDIGDWLVKPENKIILSITYFTSLLFIVGFRYGISLPSYHFICLFLIFYPQHYARWNHYAYHIDLEKKLLHISALI